MIKMVCCYTKFLLPVWCKTVLLLIACLIAIPTYSHSPENENQRNSVSLGFGFIPQHHDEKIIPAVELGYMYALNQRWGVGLGAGIHFTASPFYIIAAKAGLDVYKGFEITAATGIAIEEHSVSPMVGLELAYDFDWKWISIGPMVEFSYHNQHEHFMVGIHFSVPF